jgi:hypothetical protein
MSEHFFDFFAGIGEIGHQASPGLNNQLIFRFSLETVEHYLKKVFLFDQIEADLRLHINHR